MDQKFPFTKPEGSDAEMFIQWKGTDVCLDFYCPCGAHQHGDGYFAHHLQCPRCGSVFEMGTQVIAKKATYDFDAEIPRPLMVLDDDGDNWND